VPFCSDGVLGVAFTGPDDDDEAKGRDGVFIHLLRPGAPAEVPALLHVVIFALVSGTWYPGAQRCQGSTRSVDGVVQPFVGPSRPPVRRPLVNLFVEPPCTFVCPRRRPIVSQTLLKNGLRVLTINGVDVTSAARSTCSQLVQQKKDASSIQFKCVFDPKGYAKYDDGEAWQETLTRSAAKAAKKKKAAKVRRAQAPT